MQFKAHRLLTGVASGLLSVNYADFNLKSMNYPAASCGVVHFKLVGN
jgi:hypothetical protein